MALRVAAVAPISRGRNEHRSPAPAERPGRATRSRAANASPHVTSREGSDNGSREHDGAVSAADPAEEIDKEVAPLHGDMQIRVFIVCTVLVDALAPLLQEQASKTAGFEGSSMVLAETMTYYVGGLVLSAANGGLAGVRRCVRPARYIAFLPASIAFSSSNFLTYIAVRGLGASQFYLLAQTRVVLLAVILRVWAGVRQTPLSWVGLVQLACGVVVLVWYKSTSAEAGQCTFGPFSDASFANGTAVAYVSLHGAGPGKLTKRMAEKIAAVAAERAAFVAGLFALLGVVIASGSGFLLLEWQLKTHAQDPLYVQLHQMNSFGFACALTVRAFHNLLEDDEETSGGMSSQQGVALEALFPANASGEPLAAAAASQAVVATGQPITWFQLACLLSCIVGRGAFAGYVLKQLDAIAKGLIDVTAIIVCTGLQIAMDTSTANGTVLGIELLMIMSIVIYVVARPSPFSVAAAAPVVAAAPRAARAWRSARAPNWSPPAVA